MNTLRILLLSMILVGAVRSAEEPPVDPEPVPEALPAFEAVVLALPEGAPFPQARVTAVDREAGTFTFAWLDAEGQPVDSGNSIGRCTPAAPEAEGEPPPLPDTAALTAAIVATYNP